MSPRWEVSGLRSKADGPGPGWPGGKERRAEACWSRLGLWLPHRLHRNKGPWGRPEVVWLREARVLCPRGTDQGSSQRAGWEVSPGIPWSPLRTV